MKGITPINYPFQLRSINGVNKISEKCKVNILGSTATFFILPQLDTFDGIIGYDLLKDIEANINTKVGLIFHKNGKEKLNFFQCQEVNMAQTKTLDEPCSIKILKQRNSNAFANPNRALPYNTNVIATIDTLTDKPIYSRSYPYPISVGNFVNNEIESLLKDGIIRKSYSPYNSPVHVVSKKGLDDDGNQKLRMVIDFRKLNEYTTSDKYPIPDTTVILSNLGKSKLFTTLDLKSGFHQIFLSEKDRCKTAFSVNNGKYEFCRLPFGLKNAPSIFQRTIDDILRDDIGKICHVYVDDIIIFSPDESSHYKHVDTILKKLRKRECGYR